MPRGGGEGGGDVGSSMMDHGAPSPTLRSALPQMYLCGNNNYKGNDDGLAVGLFPTQRGPHAIVLSEDGVHATHVGPAGAVSHFHTELATSTVRSMVEAVLQFRNTHADVPYIAPSMSNRSRSRYRYQHQHAGQDDNKNVGSRQRHETGGGGGGGGYGGGVAEQAVSNRHLPRSAMFRVLAGRQEPDSSTNSNSGAEHSEEDTVTDDTCVV